MATGPLRGLIEWQKTFLQLKKSLNLVEIRDIFGE